MIHSDHIHPLDVLRTIKTGPVLKLNDTVFWNKRGTGQPIAASVTGIERDCCRYSRHGEPVHRIRWDECHDSKYPESVIVTLDNGRRVYGFEIRPV